MLLCLNLVYPQSNNANVSDVQNLGGAKKNWSHNPQGGSQTNQLSGGSLHTDHFFVLLHKLRAVSV